MTTDPRRPANKPCPWCAADPASPCFSTCPLRSDDALVASLRAADPLTTRPAPVPMVLFCPSCSARHIDAGVYATKPHHTHACQRCGVVWRPAVVDTVGVLFLPGFKDTPEGIVETGHDIEGQLLSKTERALAEAIYPAWQKALSLEELRRPVKALRNELAATAQGLGVGHARPLTPDEMTATLSPFAEANDALQPYPWVLPEGESRSPFVAMLKQDQAERREALRGSITEVEWEGIQARGRALAPTPEIPERAAVEDLRSLEDFIDETFFKELKPANNTQRRLRLAALLVDVSDVRLEALRASAMGETTHAWVIGCNDYPEAVTLAKTEAEAEAVLDDYVAAKEHATRNAWTSVRRSINALEVQGQRMLFFWVRRVPLVGGAT